MAADSPGPRVADLLLMMADILEENWPTLRCERVIIVCRRRGRRDEKETFRMPFPRKRRQAAQANGQQARPPQLRPMGSAILEALAGGETLTAKRLAVLTGYPCNSDFRGVITEMVRDGLLERFPEGLRIRQPAGGA